MNSISNKNNYNIKSVMRAFKIIDLITASDRPLTIQEVSKSLEINTNMAFRLLSSLVASGYVTREDQSSKYSISLKSLQLSHNALVSLEIRKITMPYLELLWNRYPKANVNMAVNYFGQILEVDHLDSIHLPRTYFTPGKALPFHCTALGKMLSSELDEEQLNKLISKNGLKSFTSNTITDSETLKKELEKIRREQIARDRNEYILKDNCNAAPIRNREGNIIAAISLSAFENYMSVKEIEDTIPAIQETVRKISYMTGYNDRVI